MPYLIDEPAVNAHRENLDPESLELVFPHGNCRKLGRSNKGEISGIEAEDHPLSPLVRQTNILKSCAHKSTRLEIRGFLSNPSEHLSFLLASDPKHPGASRLLEDRSFGRLNAGIFVFRHLPHFLLANCHTHNCAVLSISTETHETFIS